MSLLKKQSIVLIIVLLPSILGFAQEQYTYDSVNAKSYSLYNNKDWTNLLTYGKDVVNHQVDFPLLRLRLGYAAFQLNNYSEAIKHYEKVIQNDSYNSVARYYLYVCNGLLNNNEIGDQNIPFIAAEAITEEKKQASKITEVGIESSYKATDLIRRGNSLYGRFALNARFGYQLHVQQSIALYNSKISEPLYTAVNNNANIQINQIEYYNKTSLTLNKRWLIIGAYHYLHTPFNNLTYENNIGMLGLQYNRPQFSIQTNAIYGKLIDSSFQQYTAQLKWYPLGNLNFYSYTTGSLRKSTDQVYNVKQVIGFKASDHFWAEGYITLGKFKNITENDILYVYNAIDRTLTKKGVSIYSDVIPGCILQIGYAYEQLELYKKTTTFNQHSIIGGIKWKF
jgi:hypothetical protein